MTKLPIRILSVDGDPVYYPAVCTNLSRGGIGFETAARLEVGKVIEFEFVQVIDEAPGAVPLLWMLKLPVAGPPLVAPPALFTTVTL